MFKRLINHEEKRNSFVVALATEMSEISLFGVIDSVDLLFLFCKGKTKRTKERKKKQICD